MNNSNFDEHFFMVHSVFYFEVGYCETKYFVKHFNHQKEFLHNQKVATNRLLVSILQVLILIH